MHQDGNGIILRVDLPRRKQRALVGNGTTHEQHGQRRDRGLHIQLEGLLFSLPMTLAVNGNTFQINNYFGEHVPHCSDIDNVEVKVSNKVEVTVSGIDKESVGQTAATLSVARP